jgi:hypothetical protein
MSDAAPTTATRRSSLGVAAMLLLVAVVAAGVMARITTADFVELDDFDTIARNKLLEPTADNFATIWTTEQMALYVPVTYTVWFAISALTWQATPDPQTLLHLSPTPFKVLNVLTHAAASALAAAVLWRLLSLTDRSRTRRPTFNLILATLGGLLFAAHPVQVESVGWTSGFKDLLCTAFMFAAIYLFTRHAENDVADCRMPTADSGSDASSSRSAIANRPSAIPPDPPLSPQPTTGSVTPRYIAAIALTLLALLSKPTAMAAPVMMILIDRYFVGRPWRTVWTQAVPFLAIAVPLALVARAVQPGIISDNRKLDAAALVSGDPAGGFSDVAKLALGRANTEPPVPLVRRPLLVGDTLAFYLQKLVWPADLAIDYGRTPSRVLASPQTPWIWLIPAAVGVAAVLVRRRAPAIAWGLALAVLPLAPVSGVTRFDYQYISGTADHYLYPAMLGVALVFAALLRGLRVPAASVAVGVVIVAALGVLSWRQSATWLGTPAMYGQTFKVNPESWLARSNLSAHFVGKRQLDVAESYAMEALARRPGNAASANNLALVYLARAGEAARPVAERRQLFRDAAESINLAMEIDAKASYRLLAAEIAGQRATLEEAEFRRTNDPAALAAAIRWFDRSAQLYQQALKADPADEATEKQLAQLDNYVKQLKGLQERLRQRPTTVPGR